MKPWMTLSQRLGKTLTECMRGTTHRQFVVWCRRLLDEANEPDRADHYSMRITQALYQVNHKDGKAPDLDKLKIPFTIGLGGDKAREITEEERELHRQWKISIAKGKHMLAAGVIKIPPEPK